MKYIATRDLRSNPSAVWETLDEGSEVIVTVNGKPKAIMIRADEDLEFLIKAISRAKAELASAMPACSASLARPWRTEPVRAPVTCDKPSHGFWATG